MDRRMAVGMLGAATIGALSTRQARADDSETSPIAAKLKGRRVAVFAGDLSYEGTVDMVVGSLLYLSDVRWGDDGRVKEAVVDFSACNIVALADAPATTAK
jgi:hypothetical protein